MKKIVTILTFLFVANYFCVAQEPKGRLHERIEVLRVAFMTNELNLTAEEAQKFWPVYNPYFAELKKAKQENKQDQLKFEEQALAIRKKYKPEFLKVLGNEQRVNRLFVSEQKFLEMLRRELEDRREERRGMRPPPNRQQF